MSFTPNMPDSAGEFQAPKPVEVPCRKCTAHSVTEESWESSCGGWEDWRYTCHACGHRWWVEGIDS